MVTNGQLFLKTEFSMRFNISNKIKHNENNRKKEVTKLKFKKFDGWVINIKMISFPSLPPIIFKLNNRNERKNTNKKKKFF